MKYNKSRKTDGAFLQLKDYVDNTNELNNPKNEILLITGSGPKGKLCSLTALQRLQQESIPIPSYSSSMAVALNPFFPNKQDHEDEKRRLEEKLATGIVSKAAVDGKVAAITFRDERCEELVLQVDDFRSEKVMEVLQAMLNEASSE
eukprot:scaffold6669_cov78-Skeletonema_dohrnii-CCMP3373.AAC.2